MRRSQIGASVATAHAIASSFVDGVNDGRAKRSLRWGLTDADRWLYNRKYRRLNKGHRPMTQDYVTHKAALILSLEARKERMASYGKENQVNPAILEQKRTWGEYKERIINKMNHLKAAYPGFDWEFDWAKVKGV